MGLLSSLISLISGNIARASDLNTNFSLLANAIPGTTSSVNGSTTGTAVATCIINNSGIIVTIITLTNFRNGTAGDALLSLPVPYTHSVRGSSGDSGAFHVNLSGSNQTLQIHTSFGSGTTDGAVSPQTVVHQNNEFHGGACDALGLFGSDASTHGGNIILIGS